jgi:hypothetical protein
MKAPSALDDRNASISVGRLLSHEESNNDEEREHATDNNDAPLDRRVFDAALRCRGDCAVHSFHSSYHWKHWQKGRH